MQLAYNILLGLGVFVAVVFTLLVFITGKGDAMSGGAGGVRTTFKGKASFDDQMSKITIYLGMGFMALMLVLDFLAHRIAIS